MGPKPPDDNSLKEKQSKRRLITNFLLTLVTLLTAMTNYNVSIAIVSIEITRLCETLVTLMTHPDHCHDKIADTKHISACGSSGYQILCNFSHIADKNKMPLLCMTICVSSGDQIE